MEQNTFSRLVKQHFRYLVDEYNFVVGSEQYDPEHFGNALVDYHSRTVGIRIVLDRGQVLVAIGPLDMAPESWPDIFDLLGSLGAGVGEFEYILPEATDNDALAWQVVRLARLLQSHGSPVLRGESVHWQDIREAAKRRAKDEYERLTGKAYPQDTYSDRMLDAEKERAQRDSDSNHHSRKTL